MTWFWHVTLEHLSCSGASGDPVQEDTQSLEHVTHPGEVRSELALECVVLYQGVYTSLEKA